MDPQQDGVLAGTLWGGSTANPQLLPHFWVVLLPHETSPPVNRGTLPIGFSEPPPDFGVSDRFCLEEYQLLDRVEILGNTIRIQPRGLGCGIG